MSAMLSFDRSILGGCRYNVFFQTVRFMLGVIVYMYSYCNVEYFKRIWK
jgi:hypothetical protein